MHTSRQLREQMFELRLDGAVASREELLPEWGPHDRVGVVLDSPFAALGASYLIQLAITAYYDCRPQRRQPGGPYPEVYLFHAGSRFGDHSYLDVFPPRKEVFLGEDPRQLMAALNDRAITRLLVPDREPVEFDPEEREPAAALDLLRSAFAYAPGGRVERDDVRIGALAPDLDENAKVILWPRSSDREQRRAIALAGPPAAGEVAAARPDREDEVSEATRIEIAAERELLSEGGVATESYRRLEPAAALRLLGRDAAA